MIGDWPRSTSSPRSRAKGVSGSLTRLPFKPLATHRGSPSLIGIRVGSPLHFPGRDALFLGTLWRWPATDLEQVDHPCCERRDYRHPSGLWPVYLLDRALRAEGSSLVCPKGSIRAGGTDRPVLLLCVHARGDRMLEARSRCFSRQRGQPKLHGVFIFEVCVGEPLASLCP
jgi:hypothetical protein